MSGGIFEYKDTELATDIFGYEDKPKNVFEDMEISEPIFDVFHLIHEFDWYKSGDTSEEDYIKAKNEFKSKWLKDSQVERTKRHIDESVDALEEELYETFIPKENTKE